MKRGSICIIFFLLALVVISADAYSARKVKILHIMSYHSPWHWTDRQFEGFCDALEESLQNVEVEYKVFQMDTKRRSSEVWIQYVSARAIKEIETWRPDLVYVTDDNALRYVVSKYMGEELPFVFSGVNAEPQEYGYPVSNVTGVLERIHFIETIRLAKKIVPSIRRVAYISDDSATFRPVLERLAIQKDNIPGVEIHFNTVTMFAEWENKINEYQTTVDAIFFGGTPSLVDEDGNSVFPEEVKQWTHRNNKIPDMSAWVSDVEEGGIVCRDCLSISARICSRQDCNGNS